MKGVLCYRSWNIYHLRLLSEATMGSVEYQLPRDNHEGYLYFGDRDRSFCHPPYSSDSSFCISHQRTHRCYPLRRRTGMEASTMSTEMRPCWPWYVTVRFLRNYFLIGFIEGMMAPSWVCVLWPGLDSKKPSAVKLCLTDRSHEWDRSSGPSSRFTGLLSHPQRHFDSLQFLSPVPLNVLVGNWSISIVRCIFSLHAAYIYFLSGTVCIAIRCIVIFYGRTGAGLGSGCLHCLGRYIEEGD